MQHRTRHLLLFALFAGVPGAVTSAQAVHALRSPAKDTSCTACTDFYRYANQATLDGMTIPATMPAWGSYFDLNHHTLTVIKSILERAAADTHALAGSRTQQIGAFYASCMDTTAADAQGLRPLAPMLASIDAIRTPAAAMLETARLQRMGAGSVVGVNVGIDPKDSRRQVLSVGVGGLGLPSRDYYLKKDAAMVALRTAYVDHMVRTFELSGTAPVAAQAAAQHVMAIETALAEASLAPAEQRDPVSTYHMLTFAELQALAPAVPLRAMLGELEVQPPDSVLIREPKLLTALGELLARVPVDHWREYLRWHLVSGASTNLSAPLSAEAFRFSQRMSGVQQQPPRWQRCVGMANSGGIAELVGHAYVDEVFPAASKARMTELVANLRAALGERIRSLEWMSEPTKQQALAKLASFRVEIGYPDKWRDYSALKLDRGPFVRNVMRIRAMQVKEGLSKLGTAPDPGEWHMPPQTVDAQAGSLNTIVFPAGILQPPFFDHNADDATNYGAIGAVIGHEMTHHFDDNGRHYDAGGNLRDWWTPEDAARYNERARKVVEQFDSYIVLDSLHPNGELELGENIADLGGVKVAYLAMEKALEGKPRAVINGLTPEQRFFLGYARVWAVKTRPEYLRQHLATDPHAPWNLRVLGPLSNLPEFAKAFGCKAGDPMVRPDSVRVQIW